jgi:aspartyl-tRNA(Asn)/glutamyl-tRNA(Gln) amidotransferase subunit A
MPAQRYDDLRPARLDGVRLGVIDNFSAETVDADVTETFAQALDHLRRLGATIIPVSLPTYDPIRGRRACFVRVEAEAAFHHGTLYAQESERFSPVIRGHLDYGLRLSAQQLLTADRRMDLGAGELNACFDAVDAIVSPATPQAAPAFDTPPPENVGTFSVLANFAGCPAISVPMGMNALGLPLGLQFIGPAGDDRRVLAIAAACEAAAQN